MSFLKYGAEAAHMYDEAEKERKSKKVFEGKTWRYRLTPGEEGRITFVDGELDANGLLRAATLREHTVKSGKRYDNYVCTMDTDGQCPLCEMGDDYHPALISVLTVIDHRVTKSKDGQKEFKNQPRLFVFKSDTKKLLQSIATKRGGLAGATFDALRSENDRSPNVGTSFDFIEKHDVNELKTKYIGKDKDGKIETLFKPLDYEKELVYMPPAKLRELGFGTSKSIGGETPIKDEPNAPSGEKYDNHL